MTEREWRLRRRLDAVSDERDELADTLRSLIGLSGGRKHRCGYCGRWTFRSRVCPMHRDLPQLEAEAPG